LIGVQSSQWRIQTRRLGWGAVKLVEQKTSKVAVYVGRTMRFFRE